MPDRNAAAVVLGVLRSLRPLDWSKNVFLFAALVFARRLTDGAAVVRTLAGFAAFCALGSAVYLVNDVLDVERDRRHPVKRLRPIAAGTVPRWLAALLSALLFLGGLGGGLLLGPRFAFVAALYAASSLAYCFGLKRAVVLDVMILAAGYTLRAVAGARAIDVEISSWLLICTSLLALFLGFCKRRQELTSLADGAAGHRAVLADYSPAFLDQMIAVVTASTVMSYLLYVFSEDVVRKFHTRSLALTAPFVLYGIFRYLYLVHVRGEGGRPSRELLTDAPLAINFALYALTVFVLLYVLPKGA